MEETTPERNIKIRNDTLSGIIHPCSHPNDEDAHFRISEQEIFQNIFNYIEVCVLSSITRINLITNLAC